MDEAQEGLGVNGFDSEFLIFLSFFFFDHRYDFAYS